MRDDAPALAAVHVLPLAGVGPDVVRDVVARLSRAVAVPCRVLPPAADVPREPLPGRAQLDADRLLAALEARPEEAGVALLALTSDDLGSPIFTHFFGRSRLRGRVAVVSVARLACDAPPGDPAPTARRAALEALHELGHVAGLGHCDDAACVLRFAATVQAVDVRGTTFCDACAARLPEGLAPRR